MASMMKAMQEPTYKAKIEDALKGMKEDTEMGPLLQELETQGPMAMMKCVFGRLECNRGCNTHRHRAQAKSGVGSVPVPAPLPPPPSCWNAVFH